MRKFALTLAAAALAVTGTAAAPDRAEAAGAGPVPPQVDFQHDGFFGTFDRAQLQRGLQVYQTVCAACHGISRVRFRELEALGYTEEQIKAFAATFEVQDGPDENGDMFMRPAEPSDAWPSPYRNEQEAAMINGGKAPPDLSLIVKSRNTGVGSIGGNFLAMIQGKEFTSGASYVKHMVGTGYVEDPTVEDKMSCGAVSAPGVPLNAENALWNEVLAEVTGEEVPAGISYEDWLARLEPVRGEVRHEVHVRLTEQWEPSPGSYFNKWYPGCAIAMPNVIFDDAVEYADGTPATVENMTEDVAAFLTWTSEPTLEARKETGVAVLLFLAIFTGVMIAVKRNTWRDVKKH
jgi:ubiquinol-cytochrome c reductase cytochrome c1 subunit